MGQALSLQVDRGPAGELLARDAQGLMLPLPVGSAQPGDVLLMRVVATQPQIELQLIEHRPASTARGLVPALGSGEVLDATPAFRSDQALLLRLRAGSEPAGAVSPAKLAALWREGVQAEILRSPGAPAAMALADHSFDAPIPLYPLPGWPQATLLLRLLSPAGPGWPTLSDEAIPGRSDGAHPGVWEVDGLRLQLSLRFKGDMVQVLLQWQRGLLLYFAAESSAILQALQLCMPQMAAALASIPVPLRYSLFGRQLPAGQRAVMRPSQALAHSSCAALFRAAAEIAAVLHRD